MKISSNILVIAHAGDTPIAPGNSLKSFQKKLELNADFIEFDLRLSMDGEIVIFHDENTLNVSGHDGLVNEMTMRELKQLSIGEDEKIPTLPELITIAKGRIKLQPEIKVPGITQDLVSILRKNVLIESSIVSCFEIVELLKIKDIEPTLKIGYLIPRLLTNKRRIKRYLQRAIKNEFHAIHPYYKVVDREFVELAHDNGLKVNVWTVNEERMMRKLIDLDVDGIMTDDIALLNKLLGRSY